MAALDAACYGVGIHFRVPYSYLCLSAKNTRGGRLGRLFRLPPTVFGTIRRFGIEKAVRGSCFPVGYVKALLHRMECILWDATPHPGYGGYSCDDDSPLDYPTHGNYHAQLAPPCPGYNTVAPATTRLVTPRVAHHSTRRGTSPSVRTLHHSGNEDASWAAAFLFAHPPLPRISPVAESTTINPQTLSPGPSHPCTVPISTRPFASQSHPTPVHTDLYGGEEFAVLNHAAVSEATSTAGTPYSVRPVDSRSLFEMQSVESLMLEIRRHVLSSISGLSKRISTSQGCRSGGFASYSGRNASGKNARRSRRRLEMKSLR